MTELKVTQADRDAAAAYYYSAGGSPKIANEIRAGKKDSWFRVKAFAAHRIASQAELVEALETAKKFIVRNSSYSDTMRAAALAQVNAALNRARGECDA